MFDLWKNTDNNLNEKIASFQKNNCREYIDATKIKVDECSICPYEGYNFLRLTHLDDNRVKVEEQRRYEIKKDSISYLLIKYDKGMIVELIPLHSNSENLYAINNLLGLKLTSETVVPYLIFYGLVIAGDEGSFYFISNINQLETIRSNLDEYSLQTLDGMIRGSFEINDAGNLSIDVKQKKYPLLGSAFKFTIPTIYAGAVFKADLCISESGIPSMDDDESTTIQGLDDKLPIQQRYPLQFSSQTATIVQKNTKRNNTKIKYLNSTLLIERVISILLLPAYLLSMFIVFSLGTNNKAVYLYYNELNSIDFLNWTNLIIGTILLAVVIVRFLFLEIMAYTNKLVPSKLSQYFSQASQGIENVKKQLGIALFLFMTIIEFILGAFLALNLFIYGLVSIFPVAFDKLNFIEIAFMIFFSIPGVELFFNLIFGFSDNLGLYSVLKDNFFVYLSSTVISTVTIGYLIRIFLISNNKKS